MTQLMQVTSRRLTRQSDILTPNNSSSLSKLSVFPLSNQLISGEATGDSVVLSPVTDTEHTEGELGGL